MKFINWINGLSDLVKWIIVITSLITAFGGVKSCSNKNDIIEQKDNILNSTKEIFKTKLDHNAAEIDRWQVENKELRRSNGEISAKNSEYLNEISKAKKTISELNIKLRNVENYQDLSFQNRDTVYTDLIVNCDSLVIAPIREPNMDIDFLRVNDSLRTIWFFRDEFSIVAHLKPKLKENGKKHFPNWGNLPWVGWDDKSTVVVKGKNSEITNYVEIDFTK